MMFRLFAVKTPFLLLGLLVLFSLQLFAEHAMNVSTIKYYVRLVRFYSFVFIRGHYCYILLYI